MSKRMIDRNAHRFGASASMIGILIAFAFGWGPIAPVMTGIFAIGVVFGLRFSPMGLTYRALKSTLKLKIAKLPEEEAPPRFAQFMGLLFMSAATIVFYAAGSIAGGWSLVMIVAALQGLLGVTGICVGCEVYLFSKRLTARASA